MSQVDRRAALAAIIAAHMREHAPSSPALTAKAAREAAAPTKKLEPGIGVQASDRMYVTDRVPSTLRRQIPKVRGKAARKADKRERQEARRVQARRTAAAIVGAHIEAPEGEGR